MQQLNAMQTLQDLVERGESRLQQRMALRSPSGAEKEAPLRADSYYRGKCSYVLTAVYLTDVLTAKIPVFLRKIPVSAPTGIRHETIECLNQITAQLYETRDQIDEFPDFWRVTGIFPTETGSI
jgi:hypothetical protein